jgi:hypothetical protein
MFLEEIMLNKQLCQSKHLQFKLIKY